MSDVRNYTVMLGSAGSYEELTVSADAITMDEFGFVNFSVEGRDIFIVPQRQIYYIEEQ